MLVVFVRTLILYLIVVAVMRIMGKRQIGQLQPFELVIAIMISELAAVPMQNTGIPLINGIIPIFTLLIAQVIISVISMNSSFMRQLVCGKSSILISNGKINEKNLKKEVYSLSDLLEQLRIRNMPNISDIEFAILETNGDLTIVPKSQKRPVTPEDLKIPSEYEGLPLTIISNGKVDIETLHNFNLDYSWLKQQLANLNIANEKDVLIAILDTKGNLYYQMKSSRRSK